MARYIKEFPMVDYQEKTYGEIFQYLASQKFEYRMRDGEQLFQKGKGFWAAPSFVKLTYSHNSVRLEAWIDAFGDEQGLEGFVGVAVKKPLQKIVTKIEEILQRPGEDYVPQEIDETQTEEAVADVAPRVMPASKKEYYKFYAAESFYYNLRVTAIVGYVLCGISALTLLVNPFGIIDLAIYLTLVLCMHLRKSKGCAIAITIYAACSMALILVSSGTLGGWGWLIVGIYSWIVFNNADKRYKKMMENA